LPCCCGGAWPTPVALVVTVVVVVDELLDDVVMSLDCDGDRLLVALLIFIFFVCDVSYFILCVLK
jgi:hypothetical protein